MFDLKGNAPTTTQITPPASGGGFFDTLRNDFKAAGDKLNAPYNAMSQDEKKRYGQFNQMAMAPPKQAQFSPVQFSGGGGGDQSLLLLLQEMKKRGF